MACAPSGARRRLSSPILMGGSGQLACAVPATLGCDFRSVTLGGTIIDYRQQNYAAADCGSGEGCVAPTSHGGSWCLPRAQVTFSSATRPRYSTPLPHTVFSRRLCPG